MHVLVIGAAGTLGHLVASQAEAAGHTVRRSGRTPHDGFVQVDAATGDGLAAALDGIDAVVQCASAPFTRSERAAEADAMRHIRAAAPDVRILYPSIVGIDSMPSFRYYRTKVAAEQAVANAGGEYAIVRFTQFHEFADRFAAMPVPVFPRNFQFQSLAASEAAAELVRLIDSDEQGLLGDFGGPEVVPLVRMVKQRLAAEGKRKLILPMPMGRFSRDLKEGKNWNLQATQGRITWEQHLAEGP